MPSAKPPLPLEDLNAVLAGTQELWRNFHGGRLFVTGGTGFFGMWLTETFLHCNRKLGLNAHLTLLTRDPAAFARKAPHLMRDAALTLLQGDVRTFDFPAGRQDSIVHAATKASARQMVEAPGEMLSTMLRGTERVLAFAHRCQARKFLLTSSGAVYGPQPAGLARISEAFPQAPNPLLPGSVYGEGKRVSELLCSLAATSTLEIKVARCFAFVGPHLPLDTHFAAGNFIADALAERPIVIESDGRSVRSYLYAADLALWLWHVLFLGRSRCVYNVGSEKAVSIGELAEIIAALSTPPLPLHRAGKLEATVEALRYVPCTQLAQTELGVTERIGLADALRRTLAWERLESTQPVP